MLSPIKSYGEKGSKSKKIYHINPKSWNWFECSGTQNWLQKYTLLTIWLTSWTILGPKHPAPQHLDLSGSNQNLIKGLCSQFWVPLCCNQFLIFGFGFLVYINQIYYIFKTIIFVDDGLNSWYSWFWHLEQENRISILGEEEKKI